MGNISNCITLGVDAKPPGTNKIQLGNTEITNINSSGSLTLGEITYPNADATLSGSFLLTDKSGMIRWFRICGCSILTHVDVSYNELKLTFSQDLKTVTFLFNK